MPGNEENKRSVQSVFSVVLDFGVKDNIDKVDLEKPDIKAKIESGSCFGICKYIQYLIQSQIY